MKTFHKVFLGYQYFLEFKLPEKAKNISAAIAINVPRKQRKNCWRLYQNESVFTSEKGTAGLLYEEQKCKFNWNGVCEGENYVQRAPYLKF